MSMNKPGTRPGCMHMQLWNVSKVMYDRICVASKHSTRDWILEAIEEKLEREQPMKDTI